jgi:hypothetical protein
MSKHSKMSDASHQMFIQTWNSICSRFDNAALEKFKEQAKSDAETWIQQRLMKAIEGSQIDKNFISLFQHQVVTLFQLYFLQRAQTQLLFDKDKKLQIEQAQNAKLTMDNKEVALQRKQSQHQLESQEQIQKELQDGMNQAIQEKVQYKITSDEKLERLETLTSENQSLREKIYDLDDEIKKYKKQVKNLQDLNKSQQNLQVKLNSV